MKPKIAIVRGKFLNAYEMQFFEPLVKDFDITAFGSLTSYQDQFAFHTIKLPSPMDLPEFPYKMPTLNRMFIDAHYLYGLESRLHGFDLVHTAETYFHYTQQCLDTKKKGFVPKVIATVLENIPFNNESIWGRKAFKKRARNELDHIIALTQKTKNVLLDEGANASKISVISHFVDSKRFAPLSDVVRRRLQENKKEFVILFSGRLEAYKGVFDILDMLKILKNDNDLTKYMFRMTLVGNGSQKTNLEKKAREYGISSAIDYVQLPYDQMPEAYAKADICVLPSKPTSTYEEQYCTALLEAQAAGLPIVTTNTGGIPENIGNAGVVVDPGQPKLLYEAVKQYMLSADLRKIYIYKALERAKNVHDKYIGAAKLRNLYLKVLSTNETTDTTR